jgi:nucleotide-binding universal stress UspA family protein
MDRLLLAYDGTPCADVAIEDLLLAGLPAELEAVAVSVADVWLPADPYEMPPGLSESGAASLLRARERALAAVESSRALAERARQRVQALFPKWRVAAEGLADSPAWGVVKRAEAMRAELISLGSHGKSLLDRVLLGSVSHKVAIEAHCSVRIARPRLRLVGAPLRAIVAVDGSEGAEAALATVAARAWPEAAEFRIAAVIGSRLETALAWPAVRAHRWMRDQDCECRESIDRMVEDAGQKLRGAGLAVETRILSGDPKQALLEQAESWQADAIFLGAQGLHRGGRRALGTMASGIAARAPCSVEVVRA